MKWRKFLSLLVLPAMAGLVSAGAEALMTIENDRTLDSVFMAGGRNAASFFCEKITIDNKAKSKDGRFPAILYTCQGEALKTYLDPVTGITHNAGEKGNFTWLTTPLNIKGIVRPSANYTGYVFLQGFHPTTGMTSVTLGRAGLIPTVTVAGVNYAIPSQAKLLRDPEGLSKALSAGNIKALGTTDTSATITAINNVGISRTQMKPMKVSPKLLSNIDQRIEGEGEMQEGSVNQPAVYENLTKANMDLVIKALGAHIYEGGK